jgi:hypothetical protein
LPKGLADAARKKGGEVDTYVLNEALRPVAEPTRGCRRFIENTDLVIYILKSVAQEKKKAQDLGEKIERRIVRS